MIPKTSWKKQVETAGRQINRFSLIIFAALACLAFSPCPAFSHGPSDLSVSYDAASQILKVDITHTTKSPDKHYIKKVEIIKNGAVVSTESYKSQPSQDKFSYEYKVALDGQDTVEVKVTCNIFGSKKQQLSTAPGKGPQ
ncbi:MAG: hypothetical protein JW943_11490 [Deltaproteobacteria bacterium]|nr:hypothetical protein [Deltaproteobacteria bacterium]